MASVTNRLTGRAQILKFINDSHQLGGGDELQKINAENQCSSSYKLRNFVWNIHLGYLSYVINYLKPKSNFEWDKSRQVIAMECQSLISMKWYTSKKSKLGALYYKVYFVCFALMYKSHGFWRIMNQILNIFHNKISTKKIYSAISNTKNCLETLSVAFSIITPFLWLTFWILWTHTV